MGDGGGRGKMEMVGGHGGSGAFYFCPPPPPSTRTTPQLCCNKDISTGLESDGSSPNATISSRGMVEKKSPINREKLEETEVDARPVSY